MIVVALFDSCVVAGGGGGVCGGVGLLVHCWFIVVSLVYCFVSGSCCMFVVCLSIDLFLLLLLLL